MVYFLLAFIMWRCTKIDNYEVCWCSGQPQAAWKHWRCQLLRMPQGDLADQEAQEGKFLLILNSKKLRKPIIREI